MKTTQYTQKWTDLDTEKWTDLWLTKEYEPDAWERIKWDKLWETEEYKEEKGEPYFELAGDEYRLFEQWRDIVAVSYTHLTLPTIYSV